MRLFVVYIDDGGASGWNMSLEQLEADGGQDMAVLLGRALAWEDREHWPAQLKREIAEYIGSGAGPSWPGHLLGRRDTPFE